jgi:hypothetical protein
MHPLPVTQVRVAGTMAMAQGQDITHPPLQPPPQALQPPPQALQPPPQHAGWMPMPTVMPGTEMRVIAGAPGQPPQIVVYPSVRAPTVQKVPPNMFCVLCRLARSVLCASD